jgi:hypothetical protein
MHTRWLHLQIRTALMEMKGRMEDVLIAAHPDAALVNSEGERTYPAQLKEQVDHLFEAGVGRIVDQVCWDCD